MEPYNIQKELENVGLFLDEAEFDNIESIRYASDKEDWARAYIRRKRPEGLTPEVAREEIVRRKHKADGLAEKLRIMYRKMNLAAFAGAVTIAAGDCMFSRPAGSVSEVLLTFAIVLASGFFGLFCARVICGIWEALVVNSGNKLLSGSLGTILSYAAVPFAAVILCYMFNHNPDAQADGAAVVVDQTAYTELKEENDALSADLEETKTAYNQALDQIDTLSDKADFFDEKVRFTTEGSNVYHRYECSQIQNASNIYYVFVDDLAEFNGTACTECNP